MNKVIQIITVAFLALSLQASAGEKVNKSLNAQGVNNVDVENLRGKVTITGWDKDTVEVSGEIDDQAKAFIFEKDGSSIIIHVEMPRHMDNYWNNGGSQLTINVPQQIRVSFKGVSSDVYLSTLANGTNAKTVSGNIESDNLSQHVELITVSGNIESDGLSGKVSLSTVSGSIDDKNSSGRLKLKAVSGNLSSTSEASEVLASSVSGEIDLTLAKVDELEMSTVSGDIDSRLSLNKGGLVKMGSVSGDIDLAFDNNVSARFNLKSNAGGDLVNRITDEEAKHAKYGPSSRLSFETGDANATVKGSTVSGRIKVSAR